ncbi:MAG: PDGLE domain-containing protein [Nitrospinae bacterium]|nr:PDGLE domain-containing protein [Nitrospinota bacterium]
MNTGYRLFIAGGLAAAIALALFISPFASSSPDGLEKVAEDKGFLEKGGQPVWTHAVMPDYQLPSMGKKSGLLAGIAGTLLAFGAGIGIALVMVKMKKGKDGR